jgi:heme exporter protein C
MRRILLFLAFGLLVTVTWLMLTVAQVSPLLRNIVYIHVPSSICALLCFFVVLAGGIAFLATGKTRWDHLALAAAEVGLVCATVLNLTGMVFSRAEWNIWWTPSLRLISSAILWFLYVGYLILRQSIPAEHRRRQLAAVYGIVAFLDVPMVYISARFIPDIHRPNFSFGAPVQYAAFVLAILGTLLLITCLIWLRFDLLQAKTHLEESLYSEGNDTYGQ